MAPVLASCHLLLSPTPAHSSHSQSFPPLPAVPHLLMRGREGERERLCYERLQGQDSLGPERRRELRFFIPSVPTGSCVSAE